MDIMQKLTSALLALVAGLASAEADDPPMNRVQFIGTHNSYHIAPSPKVRALIETFAKGEGDALDHTHRPIREQLETLKIRQLVAAGFMVRTRADSDLKEIRAKDLTRFKKAVASGAQWISTDAPEELPNLPGYRVGWEDGRVWQMNPVNGLPQ